MFKFNIFYFPFNSSCIYFKFLFYFSFLIHLFVVLLDFFFFNTLLTFKIITFQITCKLFAIGLHYLWLSAFSWMLVDAVHLYRMLTEMRDINHGPMRFYYSMGYVVPAVVVSLAVGVRAHQYGNYYLWVLFVFLFLILVILMCKIFLVLFSIIIQTVYCLFISPASFLLEN